MPNIGEIDNYKLPSEQVCMEVIGECGKPDYN